MEFDINLSEKIIEGYPMVGKESPVENIAKFFSSYCEKKSYQVSQSEIEHGIKLDVSDFSHRANVNISNKGKIWVQGKDTPLKDEFKKLIKEFQSDPVSYIKKSFIILDKCVMDL